MHTASFFATAALAARNNSCVMTLDHKAANLNAKTEGPPVITSVVGIEVCSSCVIASLCGAVTPRFGSRLKHPLAESQTAVSVLL